MSNLYIQSDNPPFDYQPWSLSDGSPTRFRGPRPNLDQPYVVCLGASQTFGRFVQTPWPARVQQRIGVQTVNLGVGGVGPGFYDQPSLLEVINNARAAVVQVMSARGADNEVFAPHNGFQGGFLRRKADDAVLSAEAAFDWFLRHHSAGEARLLAEQIRDSYLDDFVALLEKIHVPTLLLWWADRRPDYQLQTTRHKEFTGGFPHFVNRAVYDELAALTDERIEVLRPRAAPWRLPQPIRMDWPDGASEIFTQTAYYPSSEQHEVVATRSAELIRRAADRAHRAFQDNSRPVRMRHRLSNRRASRLPRSKRSFLLVSAPRCGTHMVRTALNQHPDIWCYGEVFNPEVVKEIPIGQLGVDALLARFLERGHRLLTGVTIHRAHRSHIRTFPNLWEKLPKNLPVVLLHRQNLLERHVSEKTASVTGKWELTESESRPGCAPFALDPANVERKFRWHLDELERARRLFPNRIEVSYEDACEDFDGVMAKLQEFLGVAPRRLATNRRKQADQPVSDLVTNYRQLRDHFCGTPFETYFRTPPVSSVRNRRPLGPRRATQTATSTNHRMTIKLPLQLKQIGASGAGVHRSGWPHVLQHLKRRHSDDAILLDDFVDRTFRPQNAGLAWREPWIGVFHHPPNAPDWLDKTGVPRSYFNRDEFQSSLPHLRGAVALSSYLARWLAYTLDVPTIVLKHPTEIPSLQWTPEMWRAGNRYVVQVGWYLRNLRAIHQLDAPPGVRKVHLVQKCRWVDRAWRSINRNAPTRQRPDVGETATTKRLPNHEYDALLAQCVMFLELYDASANNAVVEAIARHTPVLVNRHPAVEEYLGEDYPLFYEDFRQAGELLDEDRILAAHEHLKAMDKSWMSVSRFCEDVLDFARRVGDRAADRTDASKAGSDRRT